MRVGEDFTAAGFRVQAVCGRHAPIYGGRPDCVNLGYLVEGTLYHSGDSLHVPNEPVETLLVPLQASWLKTAEVIDFVRAVAPERAFGIHDRQVNERSSASVNGWVGQETRHRYRWLAPQESA
ncbi:MBL fold metallo-hydrolase [Nonomuraea fuscirosea]|uniref:MBL fold metallo-hydrolase n=1 Tax=Nonomuraea fuscirosea TaxID=1291556 RepID=UPI0033DB770A